MENIFVMDLEIVKIVERLFQKIINISVNAGGVVKFHIMDIRFVTTAAI
ncbi:hypothetical protein [Ruminococcus albus]|nr:hypothetical protein [Ruminococcus albus]